MDTISVVLLVVGILTSGGAGYMIRHSNGKNKINSAEARALETIEKAKKDAEGIKMKGKESALKIQHEAKKEEKERQKHIARVEARLEKRETILDTKTERTDKAQEELLDRAEKLKEIKKQIEDLKEQELSKLEEISQLSEEDAKKLIIRKAKEKNAEELAQELMRLERDKQDEYDAKAMDIVTLAVQKTATSHSSDVTTTTFPLPSDELKGRIIGKEGRNIKRLEQLTGCELIIDDTPEMIVISGFDPVRRQIAKNALEILVKDGRIHPARIEEAVVDAKKLIVKKIKEAGEAAVMDTGVAGIDPRLMQILGRLRFRTSYGQNVLLHSIEVAHLAAGMAAEIGLDAAVAKKAGLLHDIGKAVDHEIEGGHVEIGMNILKKFNMPTAIIDAMKAHHEDFPYESNEARVVQAADAISAARPGARRDTIERYLTRLKELEEVASSFEGIDKAFAIQAGREVRVFVRPEQVDDLGALQLAKDIAGKIEDQLQYPGEIKVNIIREQRFVEKAR